MLSVKQTKIMQKVAILTFMLISFLTMVSASNDPQPNGKDNKITLSRFQLNDNKIKHLTYDISNFIFRKKSGFNWPMTKIIFSKDDKNDSLRLDITAIDNEWSKMVEPGEIPYGYFVINNRLFVISTKENSTVDLSQYFSPMADGERIFSSSENKKLQKNPKWIYLCDDSSVFAKQLQAANIELLGK